MPRSRWRQRDRNTFPTVGAGWATLRNSPLGITCRSTAWTPTNSGLYQVIVNNNNNGAVTGPTNVSFWWRLSAAAEACLDIAVDGVVSNTISGETAWQKQSLALEAGEHTLTWTFRKQNAGSAGADAAWVDQFTFGTGNSSSNSSRVLHLRKRDQTKKCGLNAQQRKAG